MCCIALVVWCLTIVKELNTTINVLRAIRALPRGARSQFHVDGEGGFHIECLSYKRAFFSAAVQLLRMGIAFALAWCGCLFLVYTVSVSDLLLNTLALEFIIGIDELLFEALAPARTKHLVTNLAAVKVPAPRTWHGLDAFTVVATLGMIGLFTGVTVSELFPQVCCSFTQPCSTLSPALPSLFTC